MTPGDRLSLISSRLHQIDAGGLLRGAPIGVQRAIREIVLDLASATDDVLAAEELTRPLTHREMQPIGDVIDRIMARVVRRSVV